MATNPIPRMTEQEYLAIERASEVKSEFLNGEMIAMSGGTYRHSRLQTDLIVAFSTRLGDRPCLVQASDMRIKIEASGARTYPDISIVCGEPVFADNSEDEIVNPVAIIEVLSPSTENYDRGIKFFHYRRIPTLTDYILVSQSEMLIEHYTKMEGESWILRPLTKPDEQLALANLRVSIPLEEIYRRIKFST